MFISYRRQDSRGSAGRLYDDLSERYGPDLVFRDLDAIAPGAIFADVIKGAITGCAASIVVIGNTWVDAPDAGGRRRIDDPGDLVRVEVAAMLAGNKVVIPVLVEDATMPAAADLPADLAPLTMRNALPVSDQRWTYDMSRLFAQLDPLLGHAQTTDPVDRKAAPAAVPVAKPRALPRRLVLPVLAVIALVVVLVGASVLGGDSKSTEAPGGGAAVTDPATGSTVASGTAGGGTGTKPDTAAIPIAVGDTVENGKPAGAGNIAVAGAKQLYTFAGKAGQILYLKARYEGPCCSLNWQLNGPSGEELARKYLSGDLGRVKLSADGAHTIEVTGNNGATGTYGFRITAVPADATFPIAVGDTVENGKPAGAGNIAVGGAKQLYTFAGKAGQILYLKARYEGPCCSLNWQLNGPSGEELARKYLSGDLGEVKLSADGTHTIEVTGNNDTTGTYGFSVTPVP
ncbi:MAG: toll/interleukin-1 receptor domain-containing protein [Acidimicrobiales bacterium]